MLSSSQVVKVHLNYLSGAFAGYRHLKGILGCAENARFRRQIANESHKQAFSAISE
jgi:hypothetical protein